MTADSAGGVPSGASESGHATLSIPEIRDYQRINAELVQLLDQGSTRIRLTGAEGQRLLVSGLKGTWTAVVEVEGAAGPELAAGLNAPDLLVIARSSAADGAGSAMRAGLLLIEGACGPAFGYAQAGGTIVAAGDAGPRAGLNQSGGVLFLLGTVGALAGERQSGGTLLLDGRKAGAYLGHGRRGGRIVDRFEIENPSASLPGDEAAAIISNWDRILRERSRGVP